MVSENYKVEFCVRIKDKNDVVGWPRPKSHFALPWQINVED